MTILKTWLFVRFDRLQILFLSLVIIQVLPFIHLLGHFISFCLLYCFYSILFTWFLLNDWVIGWGLVLCGISNLNIIMRLDSIWYDDMGRSQISFNTFKLDKIVTGIHDKMFKLTSMAVLKAILFCWALTFALLSVSHFTLSS